MGTFNTSTLREDARLEELTLEQRRVHTEDDIRYRRVGHYSFITTSAWRNEAQVATGGTGLFLSPWACVALHKDHHNTDRILIANFDGSPATTIMAVCSPANMAPVEEATKFYEDLTTAVRDVPAHNFLAILGEFNARLGPMDACFTLHKSTNRNGSHLAALFQEHPIPKKTWKSFQDQATGMKRQ